MSFHLLHHIGRRPEAKHRPHNIDIYVRKWLGKGYQLHCFHFGGPREYKMGLLDQDLETFTSHELNVAFLCLKQGVKTVMLCFPLLVDAVTTVSDYKRAFFSLLIGIRIIY